MQPQGEEEQAPPRASAWTAVSAVTLVAVLVAGGLVGWIRVGAGGEVSAPQTGLDEEPPEELPGGIAPGVAPEPVAAAVDEPVLAAVVLDELPDGLTGCQWWGEMDERVLERAVATPDGIQITERGVEQMWVEADMDFDMEFDAPARPMPAPPPMPVPEPAATPEPMATPERLSTPEPVPAPAPPPIGPREERHEVRVMCLATPAGRGWNADSTTSMPVDDFAGGMGTSMTCCDAQGLATAQTSIAVPDGATWALQNRGRYWLAYPVADDPVLVLSWRYREGRFGAGVRGTQVLWVDDGGEVIDERFVST